MSKIPFISEEAIDKVLLFYETLEDETYYEKIYDRLQTEQPNLSGYLFSEASEVLTQDEHDYMMSLAIIIFQCVIDSGAEFDIVEADEIETFDEQNWEVMENSKADRFKDKITPFFEDYPQEELLVFVEESVLDDEESVVTKVGREPLFVMLKTVVDALTIEAE